MKIDNLP